MPELYQAPRNQHEREAACHSGYSKWLENRDLRLAQAFNCHPSRNERDETHGEHCHQANASPTPLPKRQGRQHQVRAPGKPLWHAPKMRQHVLRTLKLDGQRPEIGGRQSFQQRSARRKV